MGKNGLRKYSVVRKLNSVICLLFNGSRKVPPFSVGRPHPPKKCLIITTTSMILHIDFNWSSIRSQRILLKDTVLVLTWRNVMFCWEIGVRTVLVDYISTLFSMTSSKTVWVVYQYQYIKNNDGLIHWAMSENLYDPKTISRCPEYLY